MDTSQSRWPRRLMWISVAATIVAVALDRLVVSLVDVWGAGIAVPGGQYGDDDLTDRSGDFVDIGLAVIAIVLAGLAWAIHRAGGGKSVLAGIAAVLGPVLLIGACFYTPLFFSLTPQAGTDELTFGQAPGPYWYLVLRPAALVIAALSLLAAVVSHALRGASRGPAVPRPRAVSWLIPGLGLTVAAVSMLLGLHVLVAALAGLSPRGVLMPLTGAVLALVAGLALVRPVIRGGAARPALVTTGVGASGVLWIAAAVWLLLENPLVVEPSPMDYEVRQAIQPWAGPLLLLAVGVAVLAQVIVLLVASRRDVSAWLRRGETDQQAMASPLEG